jgi:GNAT superfamily N-acetyltransferase
VTVPHEIVHLAPERTEEAAGVLARAFFDDPLTVWMLPDEEHRRRASPAMFAFAIGITRLQGEAFTTAGAVDGVALWQRPQAGELSLDELQEAGIERSQQAAGAEANARFARYIELFGALRARHVPGSHWYLMVLGVEPALQGQGIGGRLIAPVMQRADEAGVPCYLETLKTRNLPFYRKHGFEVVHEGDLPDSGPHFWTMLRPPQA